MSSAWHAIHEHLMHSSSTLGFRRDFDSIRQRHPELERFADPTALLEALHHDDHHPDEKNRVLTALVETAQLKGPPSDQALILMLLALWPGLDAVLRRVKWRCGADIDELASDVIAGAVEAIRCLDLHRVNRIAATVLMNVERDLLRAHRREQDRRRLHVDVDLGYVAICPPTPEPVTSVSDLHHDVARLIGADAPLVLRVAVDGLNRAEVAAEFGLSEAAARKRYQRATRRLREALHTFA